MKKWPIYEVQLVAHGFCLRLRLYTRQSSLVIGLELELVGRSAAS
jgi:hypothetical protein